MSLWARGVVVVCLVLSAGCSPDDPPLSDADAAACADLKAALPDRLVGQEVSDDGESTTSWGDIELTCGAEVPAAFDKFSSCAEIGGVGWFLAPAELTDLDADITATALSHAPLVSVVIPAALRGSDAVLVDISPAVRETLSESKPCL